MAPSEPRGIPIALLRPDIAALARKYHPDLSDDAELAPDEVHRLRMTHLTQTLLADRAELSAAERDVLDAIAADRLLAKNADADADA